MRTLEDIIGGISRRKTNVPEKKDFYDELLAILNAVPADATQSCITAAISSISAMLQPKIPRRMSCLPLPLPPKDSKTLSGEVTDVITNLVALCASLATNQVAADSGESKAIPITSTVDT